MPWDIKLVKINNKASNNKTNIVNKVKNNKSKGKNLIKILWMIMKENISARKFRT